MGFLLRVVAAPQAGPRAGGQREEASQDATGVASSAQSASHLLLGSLLLTGWEGWNPVSCRRTAVRGTGLSGRRRPVAAGQRMGLGRSPVLSPRRGTGRHWNTGFAICDQLSAHKHSARSEFSADAIPQVTLASGGRRGARGGAGLLPAFPQPSGLFPGGGLGAWPGSFGSPSFRNFLDGSDSHLRSEPRMPVLRHFLGDRAVRCLKTKLPAEATAIPGEPPVRGAVSAGSAGLSPSVWVGRCPRSSCDQRACRGSAGLFHGHLCRGPGRVSSPACCAGHRTDSGRVVGFPGSNPWGLPWAFPGTETRTTGSRGLHAGLWPCPCKGTHRQGPTVTAGAPPPPRRLRETKPRRCYRPRALPWPGPALRFLHSRAGRTGQAAHGGSREARGTRREPSHYPQPLAQGPRGLPGSGWGHRGRWKGVTETGYSKSSLSRSENKHASLFPISSQRSEMNCP